MDTQSSSKSDLVTVTYNSCDQINEFLQSAFNSIDLINKIIIIDNASLDPTVQNIYRFKKIRDATDKIVLIENSNNHGLAYALNQGLSLCQTENVVVCNPDISFDAISLSILIDFLDTNKTTAIVAPLQRNSSGIIHRSFYINFGFAQTLLSRFLPSAFQEFLFSRVRLKDYFRVSFTSGSFYVAKLRLLKSVNLYDSNFFLVVEDMLDLCHRLRINCSADTFVVASSFITHYGGKSWNRNDQLQQNTLAREQSYFGAFYFSNKHYCHLLSIFCFILFCLDLVLKAPLYIVTGNASKFMSTPLKFKQLCKQFALAKKSPTSYE